MTSTAPTFGSLFAGVGGLDLGFESAGWRCGFQVEWDLHATSVLERHWPHVPRWGDVQTVNGADLPPVDCVTFGSPCQDLSTAGNRAGLDGERSGLFYEAMRVIKEMRDATSDEFPRWAVWENVAGALTSNRGADFGRVLDEMADAGALVIEWAVLDAFRFGVPQRRRRVFVVACFDPVVAERCPDPLLPDREMHERHNVPAEGQPVAFYRTHGHQDECQIGVSPPLKTRAPVCVAVSGERPRSLTPLEHERLMGWPDDHTRWRSDGSEQADSHRFKQCGNGVVAPVAAWVARQLSRAVDQRL